MKPEQVATVERLAMRKSGPASYVAEPGVVVGDEGFVGGTFRERGLPASSTDDVWMAPRCVPSRARGVVLAIAGHTLVDSVLALDAVTVGSRCPLGPELDLLPGLCLAMRGISRPERPRSERFRRGRRI